MADVLVRLKNFESEEAAQAMADAIGQAGGINYTDASGSTVNVTVGNVSVENS